MCRNMGHVSLAAAERVRHLKAYDNPPFFTKRSDALTRSSV
jgi:hypothetical protein